MDLTPKTHFLESIRHDKGSWIVLLSEAVDNALDAGAAHIAIRLEASLVEVEDDGQGILRANQEAIVTLGDHRPHPTTALGRFGMGFKYNAISAGDELVIESTSRDGRMRLHANWRRLSDSGRWWLPDPAWAPRLVNGGTGTTVSVSALRWRQPTSRDVEKARDELARQFYPAIAQEVEIRLNGRALSTLVEPEMTDVVDEQIQLASGKGAHVRGGYLVKAGSLNRVQLTYKHRVIEPDSTFGCEKFSGLTRMFARVELTGDWGLSRFKDEVVDDDRDELEDLVHALLRPILEKCHSAQLDLVTNELADRLNEMLPADLQATRPRRTNERPHQDRQRRESKHGKTKNEPPAPNGPTTQATARKKLIIVFEDIGATHGYGDVKAGKPIRIELARDNPDIAAWMAIRDHDVAARMLYTVATMLYEHFKETKDPQPDLDFGDPFGMRVWSIRQLQPPAIVQEKEA